MKILKQIIVLMLFIGAGQLYQAQEFDCDCTGDEEATLCVEVGDGYVVPMTQCEFDCLETTGISVEIASCDDLTDFEDFDDWEDDFVPIDFECECTGEEEQDLCVDLGGGFVVPMSQCEYDCMTALDTNITLGDCDDITDFEDFEDWEDDFVPIDFECDCTGEEELDVCVDLGGGFVMPMSQCEYDCLVALDSNITLGDCDDVIDIDDDFEPISCDCTGEEEPELCVDLGDGFVVPMSQCEYDCMAALDSNITLGDCDDIIEFEEWESDYDCTGDEELNVCVDFGDGFIEQMSTCDYNYLTTAGWELSVVDCDDEGGIAPQIEQVDLSQSVVNKMQISPNPATNSMRLEFETELTSDVQMNVVDVTGYVVYSEKISVSSGRNDIKIDLSQLLKGKYTVMLISDKRILTRESLVKL